MKESWYARKEIGKYPPYPRHRDSRRDKLNEKGMKELKRQDGKAGVKTYLVVASRAGILVRVILMPWKWRLSLISPSSKGAAKEVERWQLIAEERYGKVRHMVLQRNVERDIWRKPHRR